MKQLISYSKMQGGYMHLHKNEPTPAFGVCRQYSTLMISDVIGVLEPNYITFSETTILNGWKGPI